MSMIVDLENGARHGDVRGGARTISLFQVWQWRSQRRR